MLTLQTSGSQTSGFETSGSQTSGFQTSGCQTSGFETSGCQTSGFQTSGFETSGPPTSRLSANGDQRNVHSAITLPFYSPIFAQFSSSSRRPFADFNCVSHCFPLGKLACLRSSRTCEKCAREKRRKAQNLLKFAQHKLRQRSVHSLITLSFLVRFSRSFLRRLEDFSPISTLYHAAFCY